MHNASLHPRLPRRRTVLALGLLALAAGSCRSAEDQRAAADRDVYALIEERRAAIDSQDRPFTIEPNPNSLRRRLERGEIGVLEPLSLVQCLEIAAENSRDFQNQRERFYLSALDLTLERYRFEFQTTGTVGALLEGDGDSRGVPSADGNLGLSKLLGTGATIVGNIGLSLVKDMTQAHTFDLVSNASLEITQPLLAGANPRIVREPLTQAERDVVYAARTYERFRRTYAVDVSSRVYRILQQADAVANEENNNKNLQALRERNQALAEAGRLSAIEVDQARQQELSSNNRLVTERQSYEALIDGFKTFLGLPVPVALAIDTGELKRLEATEPEAFELDLAKLDELALRLRMDHQTVLDRKDDSERSAEVSADALRSRLGFTGRVDAVSESNRPLDVRSDNLDWQLGLDADLALDRFPERNSYREALIRVESARRDVEESGDEIRVAIRNNLRESAATLEGYRIQRTAVTLAERRVEGAAMNQDAGRATTRDWLEAQASLLDAKNAQTAALINYQLARLALFRDLELLRVDQQGIGFERVALESALPADAKGTPDANANPPEQRP